METTLHLITLNGKTVGSFFLEDRDKIVMELEGGISIDTLLDSAQRTGQSIGLRRFTISEEDEQE